MNSPNQAPLSAPSRAARLHESLRVTRSTLLRSLPTIESLRDREVGLGEPVDDRLRLEVGVVGAEDVALGHASGNWPGGRAGPRSCSGVAHRVILPRAE